MKKPIRGLTEECLKHFSEMSLEELNVNSCRARNKICEMLNISEQSGYHWFYKLILPHGINLLKLQYFLDLIGYRVIEREALSEMQLELANYLALQVVTAEEAAEYTGVTENTILRWCTSRSAPQGECRVLLPELLQLFKESAEEKLKVWRKTLEDLAFNFSVLQDEKTIELPRVNTLPVYKTNGSLHGQMIDTLAHLILAARPLAEQILSEEYTPEEREKLRQKTQVVRSNGIFDLSNLLNRLCSERARKELK